MTLTQSVLIADDEPLARERLQRLVAELPGYQVCGEAADGDAVLKEVARLQPDIVLLDIRMPGLDGLAAAAQLTRLNNPPAVIFCTAYDRYAINAFEVQAVAYLLKPVRREALADALARAGRINRVQLQALQQRESEEGGQLAVRTHRGTELIDLHRIHYCEADQKCVTLHHEQGETVTDYTLKELEQAWPQYLLRIHRHTLVGTRFLQGMIRDRDGQQFATLRDNLGKLPVSRRHASQLKSWLSEHRPDAG
ncbi:MAG: LytTR family DNA-binding domain-containing protein [Marinobacter sp.]|nr:LytTR family DNA-binding domain-containing protein [Marinobacter sp.]